MRERHFTVKIKSTSVYKGYIDVTKIWQFIDIAQTLERRLANKMDEKLKFDYVDPSSGMLVI